MIKHTQKIRLSVFDHFMGLAFKGLKLFDTIEQRFIKISKSVLKLQNKLSEEKGRVGFVPLPFPQSYEGRVYLTYYSKTIFQRM